jgi:hypothetical protein
LVILVEAHRLTARLERTRKGVIGNHLYGRNAAPGLLAAVGRFRTRYLATLPATAAALLAEHLASFDLSSQRLTALLDPSADATAITNRLAAAIIDDRDRHLDDTPTLLAVHSNRLNLVSWYSYAPELAMALRISPPDRACSVLYGPRFAIDYIQRAINVSPQTYIVATQVDDPTIATLAAGLWDPSARNSLGDIMDVISTATTLAAHSVTPTDPRLALLTA